MRFLQRRFLPRLRLKQLPRLLLKRPLRRRLKLLPRLPPKRRLHLLPRPPLSKHLPQWLVLLHLRCLRIRMQSLLPI